MIESINTDIQRSLDDLNLTPQWVKNASQQASLWRLQLAQNMEAELLCHALDKSDITLCLTVSMDTQVSEGIQNAFTLAIAPITAPVVLTSVPQATTLRLRVKTDRPSLHRLLAEAIVLLRHFAGPLFLGVLELQSQKRNLKEVTATALKRLKPAGQSL